MSSLRDLIARVVREEIQKEIAYLLQHDVEIHRMLKGIITPFQLDENDTCIQFVAKMGKDGTTENNNFARNVARHFCGEILCGSDGKKTDLLRELSDALAPRLVEELKKELQPENSKPRPMPKPLAQETV